MKIAVIGAGSMGHGIAQVASQAGYEVYLYDISQELADQGMEKIKTNLQHLAGKGRIRKAEADSVLDRIRPTADIKKAVAGADLVIEAAPEEWELKKKVLKTVDELAKKGAVIVSNTSSMSISELALATSRPEEFAGMHFFNPPQLMKLVEVVKQKRTSDKTLSTIVEVAKKMDKTPVIVEKDTAGFIVNRILIPALNNAVSLVQDEVASPEEIDKAVKLGLNWPEGPLKLIDYVGLDTVVAICESLGKELGPAYLPNPLLRQMVKEGRLGRKSGKGFYNWEK